MKYTTQLSSYGNPLGFCLRMECYHLTSATLIINLYLRLRKLKISKRLSTGSKLENGLMLLRIIQLRAQIMKKSPELVTRANLKINHWKNSERKNQE